MTTITLCRFEDGNILMQRELSLGHVPYIAISHIWAGAIWHSNLPGISWEVLASKQKAKFLTHQLPNLVGSNYFWMDILCVDQRSHKARLDVVRSIPAIYRGAQKTVVVREGGGIQRCCTEAVGSFDSWDHEGAQKFATHAVKVHHGGMVESWFDRLWPLQEVLLSDCIIFTVCEEGEDKVAGNVADDKVSLWDGVYGSHIAALRLADHLSCVAKAWVAYGAEGQGSELECTAFIKAFLATGSITRDAVNMNRHEQHSMNNDFRFHINSLRITSKPRDFILAILPQYGWYIPPENVKAMDFGKLWVDCYHQAWKAGYGFIPAITKGMTETSDFAGDGTIPTEEIPLPACLGDFVKLFGSFKYSAECNPVAFVEVKEPRTDDMATTLAIIQQSMHFSRSSWSFAHRGDLSMHGMFPEIETIHDRMLKKIVSREQELSSMDRSQRERILAMKERYTKGVEADRVRRLDPNYYGIEALKTLDAMWVGLFEKDVMAKADWGDLEGELLRMDPPFFQETMLRFAALISCDMGVSSFAWSKLFLRPVQVALGEFQFLLLATSACVIDEKVSNQYLCMQRGPTLSGKDLLLMDRSDMRVVGKLPDFIDRLDNVDNNFERLKQLYPLGM